MTKRLCALLILMTMLLASLPALAETWTCPACGALCESKFCPNDGQPRPTPVPDNSWYCPECGTKCTGKFCPNDGHAKPAGDTILPTATPAPVPTPEPTAQPVPDRNFVISPILTEYKGMHTITWTDSENGAPYEVAYELVNDSDAVQSSFWAGDDEESSTTYGTSFTCGDLIPGETYIIKIWDKDDEFFSQEVTVPQAVTFVDGKLRASSLGVSIEYRYLPDEDTLYADALPLNSLRSWDMATGMAQGRMYGLRYTIDLPQLAYSRSFFTKMAFYAPNGYVYCDDQGLTDYSDFNNSPEGSIHYWYCLGDYFFKNLLKKNESIPSGTYTVKLFLDGMLANTSTFIIH